MSFLLEISSTTIPATLNERAHNFSPLLGILLFVGFVLIALARLSRQSLYKNLLISWFKISGLRAFLKDSLPLQKRGSILLLINYLVSGGILVYLKTSEYEMNEIMHIVLAATLPLALFLLTPVGLLFTGFITGEYSVLRDVFSMKIVGAQILGLFFFLSSLLWMLNIEIIPYVWTGIVALIFLEFVSRIFKSVRFVMLEGVSWYYIILYLCTLEILPLFVAYLLVMKNFS